MRTSLYVVLSGLVLLVTAALLGPQPSPDPSVRPPDVPPVDRLDAYLQQQEARFDDLTPGTEKTIRWADSTKSRTPVSVVYLHGFSATRQETAPLADTVAARLGANLFYTRLTGHGRSGDAMGDATATDWLRDAREAMEVGRRLGDRVVLVGTSTGGTLAAWLAAQPDVRDDLDAVVLLSPNFGLRDASSAILSWPWGRQIAQLVVGSHREWEPHNETHARYWTQRYPVGALVEMMALVRLMDDVDVRKATVPVLAVHDLQDEVVDPEATREVLARWGGPVTHQTVQSSAPSRHVIAGDALSPETTMPLARDVVAFLSEGP